MKKSYSIFAKYYDEVMGDSKERSRFYEKIIKKYHPKTKSMLELGCGTGSFLKNFPKNWKLYGLDLSKEMLSIAKKKVPSAKFFHSNMSNFKLNIKFDSITCVFDSINHLTKFKDWKSTFKVARNHLNEEGVFIFDINTEYKLNKLTKKGIHAQKFGKNYLFMDVTDIGKGIVDWEIGLFIKKKGNTYEFYKDNAKEKSFPIAKIKKELYKLFKKVEVITYSGKTPKKEDSRVYFICKN